VHVQALEFVTRHASDLSPGRVLEIGSLDVNGSVRPLFPESTCYHGIDLAPGPGVDEVADAADWRSPCSYDVVVSTEVLEHAPRWVDIMTNAWEAIVPGGRLIMTCATDPRPAHSAVDGWDLREGEWYHNVPVADVRSLLDGWQVTSWTIEVATDRGDLYLRADKAA
jgi:SAM-dependent methyltransferase